MATHTFSPLAVRMLYKLTWNAIVSPLQHRNNNSACRISFQSSFHHPHRTSSSPQSTFGKREDIILFPTFKTFLLQPPPHPPTPPPSTNHTPIFFHFHHPLFPYFFPPPSSSTPLPPLVTIHTQHLLKCLFEFTSANV